MLIGPAASTRERQSFAQLIRKDPRNYIAQPTLSLPTTPTRCEGRVEPRHIDLRPFILSGESSHVTRVALKKARWW
jgi:uncharacterized circularly permuted ATP-grasp superfamily protein